MNRSHPCFLLASLLLFGCHAKEGTLKKAAEKPPDAKQEEPGRAAKDGAGDILSEVERVKNLEIAPVNPANVPDGRYLGEFPFRRYLYRVRVTVESGRIKNIEVLRNGTENDYARRGLGVVPRMIKRQSPRVDSVTGATVTSKALMKCVERALRKARSN